MWKLWMNQSCFSLGFLSPNSLWKLSTFHGYKDLYILGWEWNAKSKVFQNKAGWRLSLATWLSREFKPRVNKTASLDFFSYSTPAGVTIHLLYTLHSCAAVGGLPVTSHPRVPVAILCIFAQSWAFLHTLSLTTLTWFPPKYRVTNC